MSILDSERLDHKHQSNISKNDKYENDDLIAFQLDSKSINLYYSQLTKYSKHIRDGYMFSDVINRFPLEICKFQKDIQISTDSLVYFFNLLKQNYDIKEDLNLTYVECMELLKISKYLEVKKLFDQINEYIKERNIKADFVIQMIQYEIKIQRN